MSALVGVDHGIKIGLGDHVPYGRDPGSPGDRTRRSRSSLPIARLTCCSIMPTPLRSVVSRSSSPEPVAPPTCRACVPPRPGCRCWACRCSPACCLASTLSLSIVQMPAGIPTGTLAIGRAGAVNAALLAASQLANKYPAIRTALINFRAESPTACWTIRTRVPMLPACRMEASES